MPPTDRFGYCVYRRARAQQAIDMKDLFKYLTRAEFVLFQTFVPLSNLQGSKVGTLFSGGQTLGGFVNTLFQFSITVGAILAVSRIAWGGYLYMGSEIITNQSKAKDAIRDAVIGLLLLLAIYLILYQINPDILKLDVLKSIN
jgi:hypothetical protein